MRLPRTIVRLLVGILATALALPLAAPAAAAKPSTTSATERRRVDRVPTPVLNWRPCRGGTAECATVRLPRDYDKPKGPSVRIALLRLSARDPEHRIGSLFVNPGGPGGSGVDLAAVAADFLGAEVLDRFDVVGFDPRGTGASSPVACFRSPRKQATALAGMLTPFPYGSKEETRYISSAGKLAKGCSTTGGALVASMSTAQVARDMDVLRRAVGDKRLTYLGFSYGSYLGEVYAALFPDRIRALVLDGVIDPVAWAGRKATKGTPVTIRIKSAEGAYRALDAGLAQCAAAGPDRCPISENPRGAFDTVAKRLRAKPVRAIDPDTGTVWKLTYADFINTVLAALYAYDGMEFVAWLVADLLAATDTAEPDRAKAATSSLQLALERFAEAMGPGFAYDNSLDAFSAVLCTDSLNPTNPKTWTSTTRRADQRVPYFGRAWGWSSAQCAGKAWKARDEDSYRGTFKRTTSAPILIVGNYYDPATNYASARAAAAQLPNSVLLRSKSWGHTAYGTSSCVTDQVDAYLLDGVLPGAAECRGRQPFSEPLEFAGGGGALRRGALRAGLPAVPIPDREGLPPIVPLIPAGTQS